MNRWRVKGGGSVGNTCVGDSFSPSIAEAGAWTLHRKERLTGVAIEDVQPSVLGRLRDDVALPAVVADRDERRRCGKIPIPDIVLDALEVPHAFAGRAHGGRGSCSRTGCRRCGCAP